MEIFNKKTDSAHFFKVKSSGFLCQTHSFAAAKQIFADLKEPATITKYNSRNEKLLIAKK